MVCGLLEPDCGVVTIAGRRAEQELAVRNLVGYVPQDVALYPDLTARENLSFLGSLYQLRSKELAARVAEVLELTDLTERANDRVDSFSGGMKRRLNIGAGLLHHPKLLVLDEPTVGVDPQSRHAILERVQAFGREGMAVLYTTHYMEEAERLCDRIVIMDHGKVIANDTLPGLYRRLPVSAMLEIEIDGDADIAVLKQQPGVRTASQENGRLTVGVDSLSASASIVLAWLAANGHHVNRISSGRANLETLFLALTGRQLRD